MSIVKSFSVGNGDMFYVRHNSDNFTIIDCCLSDENRNRIVGELLKMRRVGDMTRFVSTHPDDDHIRGLGFLDYWMPIDNFYVVQNNAQKAEHTPDFDYYVKLRGSERAYFMVAGCRRQWLNLSDETRDSAGINVLWPQPGNARLQMERFAAFLGMSPNNISTIITYEVDQGARFMWMGDLETDFLEAIEHEVAWPRIDVLFAPHHGRESGRVPQSILHKLSPRLVVIGEAGAGHLHYYPTCNTITQNSAGDITFDCQGQWAHVYTSVPTYSSTCLFNGGLPDNEHGRYVGSLAVGIAAGAGV
jgi:beta-lactamase superfamily II metal-dependent hydrolase